MKTNNESKKAIIFARVSTEAQDYTEQVNRMTAVAMADGYTKSNLIVISNKESAIKLAEDEREGLHQLQSAIAADSSINAVYVFEISRLGRRMDVISSVVQWLTDSHIQLVCDTPNVRLFERDGSVSFGGQMMIYLMGVMAAQEMKIKRERFANGKKHAKEQGKFIGGTVMFGFCKDENGKLIVNESEAAVIRTAFEMYRDNKSKSSVGVEAIAQYLRDNNVCRRGKFFGAGRINKFIKQEKYKAIVGAELFDECQQILTDNYNGAKERRMAFGERLIKCSECGHNFRLTGKMYECAAHKQEYKNSDMYCDNKTHINRQMLDCTLVETVASWWLDERRKESVDRREEIGQQIAIAEKNLALNAEKIEKLSNRKKRTAINYANMLIDDDDYTKQIKSIEKESKVLQIEKQQIESRIRDLKYQLSSNSKVRTWADEFDDFDSLTHKDMYEVIHKLVDRVEVKAESKTKTVWTIFRKDSSDSQTYFADGWGHTRKLYGIIGNVAHDLSADERFNIDYDVTVKRQPKEKRTESSSAIMQMWRKAMKESVA